MLITIVANPFRAFDTCIYLLNTNNISRKNTLFIWLKAYFRINQRINECGMNREIISSPLHGRVITLKYKSSSLLCAKKTVTRKTWKSVNRQNLADRCHLFIRRSHPFVTKPGAWESKSVIRANKYFFLSAEFWRTQIDGISDVLIRTFGNNSSKTRHKSWIHLHKNKVRRV